MSAVRPDPRDLDPEAVFLIRSHVRRLVEAGTVSRQDEDEWRQELSAHVVRRRPRYDPRRGALGGFYRRLIENRAATLLKRRRARKRGGGGRPCSLDRETAAGRPFVETLSTDACRRRGIEEPCGPTRVELRLDVEHVLRGLDAEDRERCRRLMHCVPAEAARRSGVPQSTFRDWMRRVRRRFEDAGIWQEY